MIGFGLPALFLVFAGFIFLFRTYLKFKVSFFFSEFIYFKNYFFLMWLTFYKKKTVAFILFFFLFSLYTAIPSNYLRCVHLEFHFEWTLFFMEKKATRNYHINSSIDSYSANKSKKALFLVQWKYIFNKLESIHDIKNSSWKYILFLFFLI